MTTRVDPLASVQSALDRAQGARTLDPSLQAVLDVALTTVDAVRAHAMTISDARRALAHRSQVLLLLGRRAEAAAAYAEALELDLGSAEELLDGIRDLLNRFGALEAVVALVPKASAAHPGRRWQLAPLAAEAQKRIELERTAPLSLTDLERVRSEVARRLAPLAPCDHGDDSRPVARAVVRALGFDTPVVMRWLADSGACCCDCAVVGVRGPREERFA